MATLLLTKRSTVVIAFILTAAGITTVLIVPPVLYPRNPGARVESQGFYEQLRVGQDLQDVRQLFSRGLYKHLTLRRDEKTQGIWYVDTPYEWGAGNWCVYLYFDDQSLTKFVLGTRDGPNHVPM